MPNDPLERNFFEKPATSDAERIRNDQILADLEAIMQRGEGRRFVWFLLQQSSLFSDPFTGNSTTYYILGQQSVVRELIQILNTSRFLGLYRKMQDEALAAVDKQKRSK